MSECNDGTLPGWLRSLIMVLILSVFGILVPISVVQVACGISFFTGICMVFRYT